MAFIVGCDRAPETNKVSGDVKTRIPVAAEGGSYSLQKVTLEGVTSLYELGGEFVKFYIYPAVSGNKLTGQQPKTRFLKSGDTYVAEDELSQQMATIYNHMQNLAAMDNELGAAGVNTWPRDVGMAVRYRRATGFDANNAFYDGTIDAILVVPYTQNNLPIAVNAGILAHEHFHSLYYKLVDKGMFDQDPKPIHGMNVREAVLNPNGIVEEGGLQVSKIEPVDSYVESYHKKFSRGINEGLADFWAWVYTGDPDFLQASLPSEKADRTLNLSPEAIASYKFPNANDWNAQMANSFNQKSYDGTLNPCRGDRVAYCLGTEYARTLKRFAAVVQSSRGLSAQESRHFVGAKVVKTLPSLRAGLMKYKDNEYFQPESFFTLLEAEIGDIRTDEKAFLENIVTTAKGPRKAATAAPSLRPAKIDGKATGVGGADVGPLPPAGGQR